MTKALTVKWHSTNPDSMPVRIYSLKVPLLNINKNARITARAHSENNISSNAVMKDL